MHCKVFAERRGRGKRIKNGREWKVGSAASRKWRGWFLVGRGWGSGATVTDETTHVILLPFLGGGWGGERKGE